MGEVADRLAELTVTRTSPDGNVSVRIGAGHLQEIGFRPGSYERYTEPALAEQLARTAALLYVDHERGVQRVLDAAGLRRATEPSQARDESQRKFLSALRSMSVVGTSPSELVSFEIAGMARWDCRIASGTLQRLPERQFVAEVTAAAGDLLGRSRSEKALLKNEFFGARHAPPVRDRIRRRAEQRH